MYYISQNREALESYNKMVVESENYDGTTTTTWANIIEHKQGNQYAILKHRKYNDDALQLVEDLDESWFDLPF